MISKEFSEEIDKNLSQSRERHSSQIRMPYVKGMVHEVDFRALLSSVGISAITDIWGKRHPVSKVCLILTMSQLKGFGWLHGCGYDWYKYLRICEDYRRALCAWCSIPSNKKATPAKKWQYVTDFSEHRKNMELDILAQPHISFLLFRSL